MKRNNSELRITEIFLSLQGESTKVGLPTVFVRLTGCPLRCQYCDTEYAFTGGEKMQLDDIVQQVKDYQVEHVTITGGEPLVQPACIELMRVLCDEDLKLSIETSGALDVVDVDPRVVKVIDIKTPGSKEDSRNLYGNFKYLTQQDQIKFVVCDREDYEWSKQVMQEHKLTDQCEVLFSPSYQQCSEASLAQWILADRLPVRFQVQLHKKIWGDKPGT